MGIIVEETEAKDPAITKSMKRQKLLPGPLSDKELKRIKDTYELNPEPTGMEAFYKKIPTNIRLFGENIFGSDDPITKKDFTNEELIRMIAFKEREDAYNKRNMKELEEKGDTEKLKTYKDTAGKTSVNPYDMKYKDGSRMVDLPWYKSLYKSFSDPAYNVATSLGKYNIYDEDGNMRIKDNYNFNIAERAKVLGQGLGSKIHRSLYSPELFGEVLANTFETKDRPINFVIKKKTGPLAAR